MSNYISTLLRFQHKRILPNWCWNRRHSIKKKKKKKSNSCDHSSVNIIHRTKTESITENLWRRSVTSQWRTLFYLRISNILGIPEPSYYFPVSMWSCLISHRKAVEECNGHLPSKWHYGQPLFEEVITYDRKLWGSSKTWIYPGSFGFLEGTVFST